jgi:hypothetical protein
MTTTQTTRKYIRNPFGTGHQSKDGKWLIKNEGTRTYWYAVRLDDEFYPIEETKSYWRSVEECKNYIAWEDAKEAEVK